MERSGISPRVPTVYLCLSCIRTYVYTYIHTRTYIRLHIWSTLPCLS